MEKKLLNLSLDEKSRKKKVKRRKLKVVEPKTMGEANDSGEDTEVWVSDPDTAKDPGESSNQYSDEDIPRLKRENAFYGVYPESK